jgi:sarcosine oxidase subunit beta
LCDVRLLDRHEVRALVPSVAEQVVAGSYSPADGQADPALTTRAFAAAARSSGVSYWMDTAAEALRTRGHRVIGVRTERGDVDADTVVLAAGAWSDELACGIGLRLPIRTAVYQMLRSTPAPDHLLQPVLSSIGRSLSLKQLGDGAFLVGGGWPGDVIPGRRGYAVRESSVALNWAAACAVLPAVATQRVERVWCGLEAQSIDDLPFIGRVAGCDGLVLAVGFSGHGFALAPAVGRAVADAVLGRPAPELDALAPARIQRFDAAEVTAFLAPASA